MGTWRLPRAAGIAVVCTLSAACGGASPGDDPQAVVPGETSAPAAGVTGATAAPAARTSSMAQGEIVGAARMEGSLGVATDLATNNAQARIDPYDPRTIRVEVWDPTRRWWVLTAFQLPATLGAPSMHTPAVYDYSVASGDDSDGGLIFAPIGCAGSAPGDYAVDTRARRISLRVSNGSTPGTFTLDFNEVFGTGAAPWRLRGGFDYRP